MNHELADPAGFLEVSDHALPPRRATPPGTGRHQAALAWRKVVDRAKGLLMKVRGIGEDDTYGLLRRSAMDQGRAGTTRNSRSSQWRCT